jgi:hypothetical protein
MAKYYISQKNGKRKFIKDIDFAQQKLTFTEDEGDAYRERDGYYAIPTRDLIRRLFVDEYPEVTELECYC